MILRSTQAQTAQISATTDTREMASNRCRPNKRDGYWVGPTVLLHHNKHDKALHDEIFGPVLSVYAVESAKEAIEIENANPYGNAACIYTTSGATAEWFTKRFSAGMLGVNIGGKHVVNVA